MVYHSLPSLDRTFAALSDSTRRDIVRQLANGPRSTTVLAQPYPMSLPAVLKHLRVLEDAGLVAGERHGRERIYHLLATPMKDAITWMDRYRHFWDTQLDALNTYLEGSPHD